MTTRKKTRKPPRSRKSQLPVPSAIAVKWAMPSMEWRVTEAELAVAAMAARDAMARYRELSLAFVQGEPHPFQGDLNEQLEKSLAKRRAETDRGQ